ERPQQTIEVRGSVRVLREYIDAMLEPIGFLRQTAGGQIFTVILGRGHQVKIDPGHSGAAVSLRARSMRNCVSSGTGMPVAPFSFPVFHAVPAISRCAHL